MPGFQARLMGLGISIFNFPGDSDVQSGLTTSILEYYAI